MTSQQIEARFRTLIGNPNNREVPSRDLSGFLTTSLTWLADELKWDIRTDENIGITADDPYVILPQDFTTMIWVEWNDVRLEAFSPTGLDREGNWRITPAGSPTRYAIEGRRLILNPAPDSTAITTDATISWRYIGSGGGLGTVGVPGLSDLDIQLLCYDAAIDWCTVHITPENQARVQAYTAQVARRLPPAKRRWENATQDYFPTIRPDTTSRMGGAR